MSEEWFKTRGVVLKLSDIANWDWPRRAAACGLTTIATHAGPQAVSDFLATDDGSVFVEQCEDHGITIEHELHAARHLLPRELFDRNPDMFRMNENGRRVPDVNLCISSASAMEIVRENAVVFARLLNPSSGRFFFWTDDNQPMCRCPECRRYSDTDQALLFENAIIEVLKDLRSDATLAHLAYTTTLAPPKEVAPLKGIFLEFAPIMRRYDRPLSVRDALSDDPRATSHGAQLDVLDANLEAFGPDTAQVLEYWLDESLFAGWNRENMVRLPWDEEIFLDDLQTYARRGIRNVTSFAVWIDGEYVRMFGEPPLGEYGRGLGSGPACTTRLAPCS